MLASLKPLTALTAEDLMSRNVVVVPQRMSLRAAARILSKSMVTGAPVVDDTGRCVGVISSVDFLRFAQGENQPKVSRSDSCVCTAWQLVELDQVPVEEVCSHMTKDPVMASPSSTVVELAKMMTNAHIHRVIVVDAKNRPIGIVSSADVVAAVAREE